MGGGGAVCINIQAIVPVICYVLIFTGCKYCHSVACMYVSVNVVVFMCVCIFVCLHVFSVPTYNSCTKCVI